MIFFNQLRCIMQAHLPDGQGQETQLEIHTVHKYICLWLGWKIRVSWHMRAHTMTWQRDACDCVAWHTNQRIGIFSITTHYIIEIGT